MRVYPDTVEFVDTRRVLATWSPFADTTAGYDENLLEYSEQLQQGGSWSSIGTPVVTADTDVAPDGEQTADRVDDDDPAAIEGLSQSVAAPNDANWVYAFVHVKKVSAPSPFPEFRLRLTGGVEQNVMAQLNTLTGATVTRASVGTVSVAVTELNDYWRMELGVKNNTSGNTAGEFELYPAISTTWGVVEVAAVGFAVLWGAQVTLLAQREYMPTLLRDGTYTNIRLTTGGLAEDSKRGKDAAIGGTDYPILDNGEDWLRVLGDASGEGTPTAITIEGSPAGTASYAMWAFVNGRPVAGCPVDSSDLSMEFTVPGPFFLEMHEEPLGVSIQAAQETHEQHPYLYWYRVANSIKYLIYADPPVGAEALLQWEWHVDDLKMFEASAARDLGLGGAGWHWLRVEAKTAAGRVSAGDPWPEYVYALPPEPVNAEASGTSPNIVIDLTA